MGFDAASNSDEAGITEDRANLHWFVIIYAHKQQIKRRERVNNWQKYLIMTGRERNYADVLMNQMQEKKFAQTAGYVQDAI